MSIAGWSGPLMVTEVRVRDKASFMTGRPVVLSEEVVAEGPNGEEVRLVFASGHGWAVGDELAATVTKQVEDVPKIELPPPPPEQSKPPAQIPLIDLTD
jgi:hypothetical protein